MASFRAMNTEVMVHAPDRDEAAIAARAAATFARAEATFSRFRADSELARLNRAPGPARVSAPLFDALLRARGYHELTFGLFDPTVGGTLLALGYDRSFAPGALDRDAAAPAPRHTGFAEVILDAGRRSVDRPAGVALDLGGMIKGHTVDEAAALLPAWGAIAAGGDARLVGDDAWLVDVEDPLDASRTVATLAVRDAAVATSAANRRRWRIGDGEAHHLVDPRTWRAAASDLLQVTVVAPRAELADVLAKTAFLLGAAGACAFLARQPEVGAVLVRREAPPIFIGALDVREVTLG